jgi:hypothetical protein
VSDVARNGAEIGQQIELADLEPATGLQYPDWIRAGPGQCIGMVPADAEDAAGHLKGESRR